MPLNTRDQLSENSNENCQKSARKFHCIITVTTAKR